MNDREKAAKLRAKGWTGPSASDTARTKNTKGSRGTSPKPGSVEDQLRKFDPGNPSSTPVSRSTESKERGRAHKRGLPRLG